MPTTTLTTSTPTSPPEGTTFGGRAAAGAELEVEYTPDGATLRVTAGPDDADNGARLLCAALSHVRRRHGRRVHTALDLGTPTSWALLEAMRSRVGTDVSDVVLRRAGSSVMVTLELLPAAGGPSGGHDPVGAHPGRAARATAAPHVDRPRGRGQRTASSRRVHTAPR